MCLQNNCLILPVLPDTAMEWPRIQSLSNKLTKLQSPVLCTQYEAKGPLCNEEEIMHVSKAVFKFSHTKITSCLGRL